MGWGTHVNPWLFHFNLWQNPPQIKKKRWEKKKKSWMFLCIFVWKLWDTLRDHSLFFKILFIYFDYTTSSLLSPVAASRRYSSLQHSGFSLLRLLALQSTGFRRTGSNSCSVVARGLVSTGSEIVAQGRSCFVVWGILPDQGLNLFALG